MARIDRNTVDRIMDATDIVDVVGDFVSLKKRGANHWGLCPFHNDRSPSFAVNSGKGIYKCFSCGKAGSAVGFLMDLEGMTYVEALKWLARKYHIEVKERELTDNERKAEAERESLYAVNDFAMKHFEHNLLETEEGRAIGLAYFRERGISDAMIERFSLGYADERSDELLTAAENAGFNRKYLVETGLCIASDSGRVYDRFKGRVIYPVHSLSGRVVAFGGRTLKKEKTVPKYVNSPESSIYSKGRELYGLYQARSAIARKKYCILVEGYMDVISLHQSGVENVVASSGTALTEGQVALIKRFASKVTLMYDSDFAGIKAALRGINMFVAAGIALKLVLLPDGEDPDSFAQSHTSAEVEEYIAEHEEDLIAFKTEILMKDSGDDPRRRSEAINDILETISLIPDPIEQTLYIDKCASKVGINPVTLRNQVKVIVARRMEKDYEKRRREEVAATLDNEKTQAPVTKIQQVVEAVDVPRSIYIAEQEVLTYALRYGALYLCDVLDGDASLPMTTVDYISREFALDNISFSVPHFRSAWEEVVRLQREEWEPKRNEKLTELQAVHDKELEAAREQIRSTASSVEEINSLDEKAVEQARANYEKAVDDFDAEFVRDRLVRGDDRDLVDLVLKLTTDTVVLSRMHPVVNRREDIIEKLPRAIYQLKGALLKEEINRLTASLDSIGTQESREIMERILRLKQQSMEFDRYNGEIVITPFLKR